MTAFLALFVALWRWWLGRGENGWPTFTRRSDGRAFSGATYVQYAIALMGVYLLVVHSGHPWNVALTDAVGVLVLARITGHTPILYPPGSIPPADRIRGIELWLWNLAQHAPGNELKWWAFGLFRYVLVAGVWEMALRLQGTSAPLAIAALLLVATYRVTAIPKVDQFLTRIAPFYKSSGHIQFAEFFGWAWVGVVVAL